MRGLVLAMAIIWQLTLMGFWGGVCVGWLGVWCLNGWEDGVKFGPDFCEEAFLNWTEIVGVFRLIIWICKGCEGIVELFGIYVKFIGKENAPTESA